MSKTNIEWASDVWNPLVGCSRVSEGCRHCYAERQAYRCAAMGLERYEGLTKKIGSEIRWTGEVRLVESALDLPLRWKKPRRIFVNSMSDLFHEKVPDEWMGRIFETMGTAKHHTYQILTKRAERMLAFVTKYAAAGGPLGPWPWPQIWLGVSVEDQATADERIPFLLQTPAAVRWVSYEPALGPVDFETLRVPLVGQSYKTISALHATDALDRGTAQPRLDWIVVGGESGPGARPFDLVWARQTIAQGRAAGVPVFVKQLGARPFSMVGGYGTRFGAKLMCPSSPDEAARWYPTDPMRDRKGGDPAEWPEDLRIREYPK